jgi:NADPH2:quinone reductase
MEVPFIPGEDGSGEVAAVGEGVVELAIGDRVAWSRVTGAYAELAAIPSDRVLAVPEGVTSDVAAAVLLQGMTAHYLVHDTYPLQAGDRCLIHAGAGGVGRLLIQMAKQAGAEVFTTVGGGEKVDVARAAGADHVIDYQQVDFRSAVEDIGGPRPLTVVYDGVGGTTFDDGLALLKPRGMMVLFGGASGPVSPVDPLRLMREGSLYLTRPTLGDHIAGRDDLVRRADAVFTAVVSGDLAVLIGARYPLADAGDAHRALESRKTVGKILLTTG